jgi:prophage regulatory protein
MHEYLSDVDLADRFAVSRITIWRWTSEKLLPKPVRIGRGCTRWRKSEVDEHESRWLAERDRREQEEGEG